MTMAQIRGVVNLAIPTVLMTACGTGANPRPSPPAASAPLPAAVATASATSSQPVGSPLGVVVKDFLDGGPTYTVSLIGIDGRVVASASGQRRSRPTGVSIQMPNLSASNTRLYFLDGD